MLPPDFVIEEHMELGAMQPGDVPVTYADTGRLERDYGFQPETNLRTSLRAFAEWYKEYYGKITGLAIDKGIHIAFRPKQNGVIEMKSLQFPKRAQWHIKEVGAKTGDWADYLRGATWATE